MPVNVAYLSGAEADLINAIHTSAETWGYDQAVRYTARLREAIGRLADGQGHIRHHDDLYPELRMVRSGHHRVFGFVQGDRLLVVAILHVKQDPVARVLARLDGMEEQE